MEFNPICRIRQNDDANSEDPIQLSASNSSVDLQVGVLHYTPGQECFPLLHDPSGYTHDTVDLTDIEQRNYWLKVLRDSLPTVVEKAISTGGCTPGNSFIYCSIVEQEIS